MENLLEQVQQAKQASDITANPVFNEALAESILNARDGNLEKIAAPGDLYIKRRVRERSVVRRTLDFKPVGSGELTPIPSEEMPIIWGTLQNMSRGAVTLTMKDTADMDTFWRDSFIVRFFVVSTPEYYKNEFELKGHPQDTLKHLTEDMLLDLEDEEDDHFFAGVNETVGTIGGVAATTGLTQNFYFGAFSRSTYVDSKYIFNDRKLPPGLVIVNERFMANLEKLPHDSIGGPISQDLFVKGGAETFREGMINGVKHLFTSKNHLVPNNVMYQFTAADYLGLAREYMAPTLYMEKKKRTLFVSLEEIIAIGLVNTMGVNRGVFENAPSA